MDDCTIEIDNFNYDGAGLDVVFYGGTGGDYTQGPALSVDFVGQSFSNGSIRLQLPTGVDLGDFDGISVWCVTAGVSFGDGLFSP